MSPQKCIQNVFEGESARTKVLLKGDDTLHQDLYISESGQVKRASLVTGPGYGLNEAAIEAAKKFIFSPAKVGNQTMPVVIRYNYKFVIQK